MNLLFRESPFNVFGPELWYSFSACKSLSSMQEALDFIPSTTEVRRVSSHLQSRHLGGQSRRIKKFKAILSYRISEIQFSIVSKTGADRYHENLRGRSAGSPISFLLGTPPHTVASLRSQHLEWVAPLQLQSSCACAYACICPHRPSPGWPPLQG